MRVERGEPAGWTIRPYEPEDEAQALALFAHVFGREMAPEVWRWKLGHRSSAGGNRWVVFEGDRLIAHHAGIPVRMKLAGKLCEVMIAVDAMSVPHLQRRGTQTALMASAHAAWSRAGVQASMGVPNEKIGGLCAKVGSTSLPPLQWLRLPLHVEDWIARTARLPAPLPVMLRRLVGLPAAAWHRWRQRRARGLAIEVVDARDRSSDFDRLWAHLERAYAHIVVRDSAWVRWRYLQAPGFGYRVLLARSGGEPAGYLAYRLVESGSRRTGIIADVFTAPDAPQVARALIAAACDDLWLRGAEVARAVAAPHSSLYRLLRAAGFMRAAGEFDFQVKLFDPSLSLEPLRDSTRWLLTGGEFDVV